MLISYARDDTANVETVTLGSDPDDFLQVQRALEFDEQDFSLGMDTYCLVTGAGLVMYGGVEDCTVNDRIVDLVFTAEAAETLGIPPNVSIVVDGDDYREITSALTRMLR